MKTGLKSLPLFLKEIAKEDKTILMLIVLSAIFRGIHPLINIVLPKYILDELLTLKRIPFLIGYIGILGIGNFVLNFLIGFCRKRLSVAMALLSLNQERKLSLKVVAIDFSESGRKTNLDLLERGKQGAADIVAFSDNVTLICAALITFSSAMTILLKNDWRLIPVAFIGSMFAIPCFKKIKALDIDNAKRGIPENRAFRYLCNVANDFHFAKDLRLYAGKKFFLKKAEDTMDRILMINQSYFTKSGFFHGLAQAAVELQALCIFVILGINLLYNRITVGTFTMLYGAASQLGKSLNEIIQGYTNLNTLSVNLNPYYEFMALTEEQEMAEEEYVPVKEPALIAFENVSFRYPTGNGNSLTNLSFTVNPGETLAIVGQNGAGKTTLIKLLCRLYKPQQGKILLNGRDIYTIPKKDYLKELSVVFQDFCLMPFKISENIGAKQETLIGDEEEKNIYTCLRETGIGSWIEAQENGVRSFITKIHSESGLLPSGGQEQKIAIARALYRNGRIVILDEPTAALDPKSEEEIFENLINLTVGKTAIFISHRLSSTRIADRIIVLHKGMILEEGNHQMLMAKEGLYAEMFSTQAEQYVVS